MGDVKFEETEDEIKRHNRMKDLYTPLTSWWKETLTELTERGAMKSSGVKIDGVPGRGGHLPVRLLRTPGEDHEGSGLPIQGSDPDDGWSQNPRDQWKPSGCPRFVDQNQGGQRRYEGQECGGDSVPSCS